MQQPKPSINIFENVFKKDPCDISHSSFSRALFERKNSIDFVLFLEESQRIQKNIHIRYEALKQLTFTHFEANVGELKAAIQFMSAQAYLEVFDQLTETICIEANEGTVKEQPDVESLLAFNEWIPNDGLTIQYNHFI